MTRTRAGQSAEWWREYRMHNRERINAQRRASRAQGRERGDRSAEYARRRAKAQVAVPEPLPPVHPHIARGTVLAFWEEELRLDMEQERALAVLEGRDPEQAALAYRMREQRGRRGASLHLIPDHVLELAVPVTYLSQPHLPAFGTIEAKAICHDRTTRAFSLCRPCYDWSVGLRRRLGQGTITEAEVMDRVRAKADSFVA